MVSLGAETFQRLLLIKCNKNVVAVRNLFVCLLYLFHFVNCFSCFLINVMFFCILYCHF